MRRISSSATKGYWMYACMKHKSQSTIPMHAVTKYSHVLQYPEKNAAGQR